MPKLEKRILSQYLRVRCDRFLHHSLFRTDPQEGIPLPLSGRPGVQVFKDRGLEFEKKKLEELALVFPSGYTDAQKAVRGQEPDRKLARLLAKLRGGPHFLVEPPLGAVATRDLLLDALGIDSSGYPDFPDFRPDVIMVMPPGVRGCSSEIRSDGSLVAIPEDDDRVHLRVIDLKATEKLNPSYAAEVIAYSMVLAAWLDAMSMEDRFLVVSTAAVWAKSELFALDVPGHDDPLADRLAWLNNQLLDSEAELYGPPVVKFLKEDIPRVLGTDDWEGLDWGVAPTCSQCDWLGYPAWTRTALKKAQAKATKLGWPSRPAIDEYCYKEATDNALAMQIPELTVGMRRALDGGGLAYLSEIAELGATNPAFREHHGLLREAHRLPPKAEAILNEVCEPRQHYRTAQMAAYADLRLTINVSFDASSQLLIGLGLGIDFKEPAPYGRDRRQPLKRKQVLSFLVAKEDLQAEREELVDFLRTISSMLDWISDERSYARTAGDPPARERAKYTKEHATVQVLFWDRRQEEALRQAIARHLPALLSASSGADLGVLPGAIWLFPPDEVVDSDKTAETPPVCYLKNVLTRLYALPTTIIDDVVSTAEGLLGFDAGLSEFDWDRIAGVIPKERALEIWQGMPPKRPPKSLSECRKQYQRSLETLVHAMRQLVFHAVINEKGAFRGRAPLIKRLLPTAFAGVSADALLWLTHLAVEEGVGRLETKVAFAGEPYDAEAAFEALRTTGLITGAARRQLLSLYGLSGTRNRRVFRTREDSKYAKFRNGEKFLTLVPEDPVGSALMRVERFVEARNASHPNYDEVHWNNNRFSGMHSMMAGTLRHFDREDGIAVVDLDEYSNREECRRSLVQSGALDLHEPMVLYKAYGWPSLDRVRRVARAIGNPPTALPSPATGRALPKTRKPGRSPVTPAAEVLWEPKKLVGASTGGDLQSSEDLLEELASAADDYPNDSQLGAVRDCLSRRLNLVWGGPGTGKTATLVLAILVDALLPRENKDRARALVSTFSYRALAEIVSRLHGWIPSLPARLRRKLESELSFTFFVSHGRAGEIGVGDGPLGGIVRTTVFGNKGRFDATENGVEASHLSPQSFRDQLVSGQSDAMEIVFAPSHQVLTLASMDADNPRAGLFDRVWIDESSQLSVAHSLSLLALLDDDGSVGVFGDRLQMPPVQRIAPPRGAEYMVGGLQAYLLARIREHEPDEADDPYRESFLRVNYRSCEPIVAFSRAIGYEQSFEAHNPNQRLRWDNSKTEVDWDIEAVPDFSLTRECLDPDRPCVAVTYDDGRNGQANEFEAALVSACVLQYRAAESSDSDFDEEAFWASRVGVVTPHRAQRAAIVAMLHAALDPDQVDRGWIEEAVDTVERFQGGERDLVLVSFGLGDPDVIQREEEFLFQKERINVAVTRARFKVIVFVTRDLGLHLPEESRVAEASKTLKHFVYHHADEELPAEMISVRGQQRSVVVRYRGY